MAENEKPKTIFYSLSQSLKGNKKDIPSDLSKNSDLLTNDPSVNIIQQQQQRYADFQTLKVAQDLYSRSMYYYSDRISAYNDFRAMDQSPEISVALDIMSDECVTRSDKAEILTIYSEDARIKRVLKDLFHGTLNINYNLWFWIRTLLKYGDNFLKLEIDQKLGIYNITQLPTGEMTKEIGYDGNPHSVRFKWDINNMYFEDFQIAHFSLISDGENIPYGRSVLDSVRKLWKQLQLAEDALLVYRLVRAPERRMFFIDVGNTDTPDVRQYIEKIKAEVKKSQVVDPQGRVNMKFNVLTFEEDFFIPVRGDKTGTRVETLPGACLALDTKIPLLDGRTLTLQEIINEWDEGKENLWVYSCNPQTGEFVPGMITWAGITKRNTEVMKITLDNGKEIVCTPDHKFLTREGQKVKAKNLLENQSLMPFYTQEKPVFVNQKGYGNDYHMVFDNSLQKWIFTHKIVADYFKNTLCQDYIYKYEDVSKKVRHHIDLNRYNNTPNNLCFMNFSDHRKLHADMVHLASQAFSEKYHNNPEFAERVKANLKKGNETFHAKRNNNPEFKMLKKKKKKKGLNEYFKNLSVDELKQWCERINNPETKEKATIKLLEWCKNPENLKIRGKILSIIKSTPEAKKKFSKASKKLWATPGFKEKVFSKEQKIIFTEKLYQMFVGEFENNLRADLTLKNLNSDLDFMNEFVNYNANIRSSITNLTKFTHNHLEKMVKEKGFKNFREWKNNEVEKRGYINIRQWKYSVDKEKTQLYNHKIIKIEYLQDKIDTGTITVDGNELYHNYHTFALESGVYNFNSNLGDIADIEYLQNKLFTGIKVPKTYLNYGDALPGGSTLSQADLRFARTINRFQEAIVLELRNIANIHLKLLGFDDDINNFTLTLTNPSTQQELLKLETMKARLDVFKEMFSSDATAPVSYSWAMEYILGFSKSEIKQILRQKKVERKMFYEIERSHEEYMDTGIFTELDKKFRKPDFDPNTQINPDEDGGGDDTGGGGGFGGFGGGSSFGLGDTTTGDGLDDLGGEDLGGGDESPIPSMDGGPDDSVGGDENEPEDTENLKENLLLSKNKVFDNKTKSLLEGINSFLNKINKIKEE